jgi:superfamily II DNA/RNA helicase
LIGGLEIKEQKRKLLIDKPAIIVGTPGRVKEIVEN